MVLNGMCDDRTIWIWYKWAKKYELVNGNGKIKEYSNKGELLFEGEYLNWKRNGKGKVYNNKGEVKFEGEYSDGKKAKGKEYIDGKLEYDGEYFNGKKNGKGKEYIDGILEYDGEYFNGKKMEKGNIISKKSWNFSENLKTERNGMEKDMIQIEMWYIHWLMEVVM